MLVTIKSKAFTPGVTYIKPTTVIDSMEEKLSFIVQSLVKEVKEGAVEQQLRKAKKMKKLLKGFLTVGAVWVKTAPKALAAPVLGGAPATSAGIALTPALVMEYGLQLAGLAVACGVALSMIMLSVAGIYRMFRKREVANEWGTDIIKGLVQVLIAIPTVYLLFYLAQFLFKNLPALNGLF